MWLFVALMDASENFASGIATTAAAAVVVVVVVIVVVQKGKVKGFH